MNGNEKRTNGIRINCEDSLFITVSKLAAASDRTLTDYIHHVLVLHAFGHDSMLAKYNSDCDKSNGDH